LPIASLTFGDALPPGSAADPLLDRVDLRSGTTDILARDVVTVAISELAGQPVSIWSEEWRIEAEARADRLSQRPYSSETHLPLMTMSQILPSATDLAIIPTPIQVCPYGSSLSADRWEALLFGLI
jgi:hypothetical protein